MERPLCYTKAADLNPSPNKKQPLSVEISGTTNRCYSLSLSPFLSLKSIKKRKATQWLQGEVWREALTPGGAEAAQRPLGAWRPLVELKPGIQPARPGGQAGVSILLVSFTCAAGKPPPRTHGVCAGRAPGAPRRGTWLRVRSRVFPAQGGTASPCPGRRCRRGGFASSSSTGLPGVSPRHTRRRSGPMLSGPHRHCSRRSLERPTALPGTPGPPPAWIPSYERW